MTIGTWGNESLNRATQKNTKKRRSLVGEFHRGVFGFWSQKWREDLHAAATSAKADREKDWSHFVLFVFVKLVASGLCLDSIFWYPPSHARTRTCSSDFCFLACFLFQDLNCQWSIHPLAFSISYIESFPLWKTARNIHFAIRWKKFLRSLDRYEFVVVVVVFVIVWDLGFKAAAGAAAPDKLHSQITGSDCSSSSRHFCSIF